jgi:hypothetical protein
MLLDGSPGLGDSIRRDRTTREQAVDFSSRNPHGSPKFHVADLPARDPCPNRVNRDIEGFCRLKHREWRLIAHHSPPEKIPITVDIG